MIFCVDKDSEFILKLTTPEQFPIFKVSTVRGSLKVRRGSLKFFRGSEFNLYKHADPKSRIDTKHETVPENIKRMFITSWYGTVPH
jgi:hypothetical protein